MRGKPLQKLTTLAHKHVETRNSSHWKRGTKATTLQATRNCELMCLATWTYLFHTNEARPPQKLTKLASHPTTLATRNCELCALPLELMCSKQMRGRPLQKLTKQDEPISLAPRLLDTASSKLCELIHDVPRHLNLCAVPEERCTGALIRSYHRPTCGYVQDETMHATTTLLGVTWIQSWDQL